MMRRTFSSVINSDELELWPVSPHEQNESGVILEITINDSDRVCCFTDADVLQLIGELEEIRNETKPITEQAG